MRCPLLFYCWCYVCAQQHLVSNKRQPTKFHGNKTITAERKIFIVFVYYIIFTVMSLLSYSQVTRNEELFTEAVLDYFDCERQGIDPQNPCDTSGYEKFIVSVVLTTTSLMLLGFYPVLNFIFVIDVQELKKWLNRVTCKKELL